MTQLTEKEFRSIVNASWRKTRPIILERDGYKCVACGSKEKLEVHHILKGLTDPTGACIVEIFGITKEWLVHHLKTYNNPMNLVTLCRNCHLTLSKKYIRDKYRRKSERVILGLSYRRKIWDEKQHYIELAIRARMKKLYGENWGKRLQMLVKEQI